MVSCNGMDFREIVSFDGGRKISSLKIVERRIYRLWGI